jgi:hypothetical protein
MARSEGEILTNDKKMPPAFYFGTWDREARITIGIRRNIAFLADNLHPPITRPGWILAIAHRKDFLIGSVIYRAYLHGEKPDHWPANHYTLIIIRKSYLSHHSSSTGLPHSEHFRTA